MLLGFTLSLGLSGCFPNLGVNDAPQVDGMLAQLHPGMSLEDVEALLGNPDRVTESEDYTDESRTTTKLCQVWFYTVMGVDEWSVWFQADNVLTTKSNLP